MIAALYVETDGVYFGLPDVEPWGLPERDAREYHGPHPVVAHPPCERWGKYWHGGPNSERYPRERKTKGADAGCFPCALLAVRLWGGVLEHPAESHAWRAFGLAPPLKAGWHAADTFGGWCCHVEQGHYGHRARKATWLYAVGCELPSLSWGASQATVRLDDGFHSAEERRAARRRAGAVERLSKGERLRTPLPFRDLLLSIAKTARAARAA